MTVVGALATVMLCVALAAPVFAFASRSSRGVVVRKLARGAVTAVCPRGEHVAFGGIVAEFHPPVGSGAYMLPEGMRRTAAGQWTVYGQSNTGLIGSRLTSVADCDPGTVAPRVASATVALPGFHTASAIATCPAGTVVVGGGFNSAASLKHLEIVLRLESLSPTQWAVTMGNITNNATTVTAIAYCSAGAAPQEVSTTMTIRGHKGATVRIGCPTGTSLLFGGLIGTLGSVGSHVAATVPFSWTASTAKQWVVTAYNVGDLSANLSALAYCR